MDNETIGRIATFVGFILVMVFILWHHFSLKDAHLSGASKLKPKITPKTDFNEMCQSCFGAMISKMPLRTICDLQEVERQRMIGCRHRAKPIGPPNTKLNGDPLD
jgi:hypothetical protein